MTTITNDNSAHSSVLVTGLEPRPFLERFDPRLVTNPEVSPKNHVLGKDPVWQSYKGTMQLIDPYNDQAIATWDCANNAAFFYGNGFLRKNPKVDTDYEFAWDPNYQPYENDISIK